MKMPIDEALARTHLVKEYVRLWPRAIFDCITSSGEERRKTYLASDAELDVLKHAGVYILYRGDVPFYIGKTDGWLLKRLTVHATRHGGLSTYFWDHFSAFIIEDKQSRIDVESILIAAIPTAANSAKPKLNRKRLPRKIVGMVKQRREFFLKSRPYEDLDETDGIEG